MDNNPIIFEDAEGRQYIEVSWILDELHELFVNSNEHGHNILDLIQEIKGYIEENF